MLLVIRFEALIGFRGGDKSCVFNVLSATAWLLCLPMLTSRQPCCRDFNWFGSQGPNFESGFAPG
jgi:hypothetical protein